MQPHTDRFFAIIPAAGSGQRMESAICKQYLPLHGKAIIRHTLDVILNDQRFTKTIVALAENDNDWKKLGLDHPKLTTVLGGKERYHSVFNALISLEQEANPNDWILVHDAVRPCLHPSDIDNLISVLQDHPVGGLLGIPVRDTLKRVTNDQHVTTTIDRNELWCAYSPQMFRYGILCKALKAVIADGIAVTDEASAIEYLGEKPKMVQGRFDNIKITFADDVKLAEMIVDKYRMD
jgi:2-C-methyl-D-erythritol 4-phosphate cytidylyltransferase